MPFDRGRGLAKALGRRRLACAQEAARGVDLERVAYGCIQSRRTSYPRDQPRGQEQASRGIDAPLAQGIERKRKALEQGTAKFSSFRALTTRARRTARPTGLRPLREGGADWPLERSLLQSFPRWHNLFLRPDQDSCAQRAPPRSPYVRTGSIGDTRQSVGTAAPDYLWGWLVHPRGESRGASGRIRSIGPRAAQPPAT